MQYLAIDGHPLIEMDIRNSQPYFAAALFNPTEEIENAIDKYMGQGFAAYIKSQNFLQYADVELYTSLVSSGKFYSYMADKFKENNIPYENKKDLKQQLFVVFFGKPFASKYNKGAALFKETFPNVQRLFNLIKKRGYNRLAILLQRIESYTMIEMVAKAITEQLPDIPFLTKHDSIMPFKTSIMAGNNLEDIRKIMVDTIYKVTGVMPQGRIRRYVRDDQILQNDYQ
jgi:hypothetical protein